MIDMNEKVINWAKLSCVGFEEVIEINDKSGVYMQNINKKTFFNDDQRLKLWALFSKYGSDSFIEHVTIYVRYIIEFFCVECYPAKIYYHGWIS